LLSVGVVVPERETIEALKNRFEENSIQFEAKRYDIVQRDVLRVRDPDGMTIEFISTN
jgi:hypothetical protein